MKNYFAFKQSVAGDCGILKYKPPCPPASDILRLYLASEADARIAELERENQTMRADWKAICDAAESVPAGTVEFQLRQRIAELEKMLRKAIDIIESCNPTQALEYAKERIAELEGSIRAMHAADDAYGCGFYSDDAWKCHYQRLRELVGMKKREL